MKRAISCLALLCLGFVGCSPADNSVKVAQSDYGERWPFTVPEGVIDCNPTGQGSSKDVVLRVGDEFYAVNGKARSTAEAKGLYKDLALIWRDQSAETGGKVAIPNEIIEQGLKICDVKAGS